MAPAEPTTLHPAGIPALTVVPDRRDALHAADRLPSEPADVDRQLLELAWDAYGSSRFIAPGVAFLILLLSLSKASVASLVIFGGWAVIAYGIRFGVDYRWRRTGPTWSEKKSRQLLYLVHIVTSLVWALTPLLIVQVDTITQFVIGVIVCTVAVTGTFDTAAEPRIQSVNIVIEMVPLIGAAIYVGEQTDYLVACLLVLFTVYLLFISQKHFNRIRETLALQNERSDLVERLRTALDQAESSSFAKTRFLANMSHELRTPLNGILGFAQMIGHLPPGETVYEKHQEYAGLIEQSGRHLLGLINDLLDIAKAESGRMELDKNWVRVENLARETVLICGPLASEKSITVALDSSLRKLEVFADEQRLKQALLNLLSNALKFTEPGGEVDIGWQAASSSNRGALSIRDTGVGMTEDQIKHAVQPFEQVQSGHAWQPQGTGLGLPIVQLIAHAHGGSLVFDSTPGTGTTARLEFPDEAIRMAALIRRLA